MGVADRFFRWRLPTGTLNIFWKMSVFFAPYALVGWWFCHGRRPCEIFCLMRPNRLFFKPFGLIIITNRLLKIIVHNRFAHRHFFCTTFNFVFAGQTFGLGTSVCCLTFSGPSPGWHTHDLELTDFSLFIVRRFAVNASIVSTLTHIYFFRRLALTHSQDFSTTRR